MRTAYELTTPAISGANRFAVRLVNADDEAFLVQTRRLIDEVIPRVAERWPKVRMTPR